MSRHGYTDECENVAMWRGIIASASRGKRGQAFFRSLVEALDAMPTKELVEGELQTDEGAVCALGCLGKHRGIDIDSVDTEDWHSLGDLFDIAPQLAQEVMYVNDSQYRIADPTGRWKIVRDWAARQIVVTERDVLDVT